MRVASCEIRAGWKSVPQVRKPMPQVRKPVARIRESATVTPSGCHRQALLAGADPIRAPSASERVPQQPPHQHYNPARRLLFSPLFYRQTSLSIPSPVAPTIAAAVPAAIAMTDAPAPDLQEIVDAPSLSAPEATASPESLPAPSEPLRATPPAGVGCLPRPCDRVPSIPSPHPSRMRFHRVPSRVPCLRNPVVAVG